MTASDRTASAGTDLVSIVIPAYNAAKTIDATLTSVRRQTFPNLEIIVVNDGSTDATLEIAQGHARADRRVRVLDTARAGVATARNRGVAESRGKLIAPIDADDLWNPIKIEQQVAAMARGGPSIGFVYTGSRRIDMQGSVMQTSSLQRVEGRGFLRSIFGNFVGNGSGLLIRRAAFYEVGGYEPCLRALGLEGAEDYLLQIGIASRWDIACVPLCLVGYRQTPGGMSRDQVRITRSQLAVIELVAERYPEVPGWVLRAARADLEARLAFAYATRGRMGSSALAIARSLSNQPICGIDTLSSVMRLRIRKAVREAFAARRRADARARGPHFDELDPAAGLVFRGARPNGWIIKRLEPAEAEFPVTTVPVEAW